MICSTTGRIRLGAARGLLACYHPPPRQQHKALRGVTASHDLDNPFPRSASPAPSALRAGAVDQDVAWPRKGVAGLSQDPPRPVAVLHISLADDGTNERPGRVDVDISLALRRQLLCRLAAQPGRHRPALDDTGTWGRLLSLSLARVRQQGVVEDLPWSLHARARHSTQRWRTTADHVAAYATCGASCRWRVLYSRPCGCCSRGLPAAAGVTP